MGNAPSTRSSPEERSRINAAKQGIINERKVHIDAVQNAFMTNPNISNAVVATGQITASEFMAATETAKTQLDRGGSSLTKTDLVAVAVALSGYSRDMKSFQSATVSDLNTYIRTVVYDPARIMSGMSGTHTPAREESPPPAHHHAHHHQEKQPFNPQASHYSLVPVAHTHPHKQPVSGALVQRKPMSIF